MTLEIPFPSGPAWSMELTLDGRVYTMRGKYNTRSDQWVVDILSRERQPLLLGLRLVLNYPLLLANYDERLPRGQLFVVDPAGSANADPGRLDFKDRLRLVYEPV